MLGGYNIFCHDKPRADDFIAKTESKTMKPILYYYQHCPYCMRVLTLAGLADIALTGRILPNDDEKTPIAMVGVKLLPILQTAPQQFMGESLDIIDYLCKRYDFFLEKNREDIKAVEDFLQKKRLLIYGLAMPRWVKMPFAEFATDSAVDYFINKKTQSIGDFQQAWQHTDEWVSALQTALEKESVLFDRLAKRPPGLAAIILFSGLLGVSCVKGFQWPKSAEQFMQILSQRSKIALLADDAV